MQCSFRVVQTKIRHCTSHKGKRFSGDLRRMMKNDLKENDRDKTKNMSYDIDVQLVAIKGYFMNEIYELKPEISQLKGQEKTGNCDSSESTLTNLKSQICILFKNTY